MLAGTFAKSLDHGLYKYCEYIIQVFQNLQKKPSRPFCSGPWHMNNQKKNNRILQGIYSGFMQQILNKKWTWSPPYKPYILNYPIS